MSGTGIVVLHDLSRDGPALVSREEWRMGLCGRAPGEDAERDLSWLDWSLASDISRDGQTLAFTEAGGGAGPGYSAYIRRMDGSPALTKLHIDLPYHWAATGESMWGRPLNNEDEIQRVLDAL
jgi:hypothetical protein